MAMRQKGYAIKTGKTYLYWIKYFIAVGYSRLGVGIPVLFNISMHWVFVVNSFSIAIFNLYISWPEVLSVVVIRNPVIINCCINYKPGFNSQVQLIKLGLDGKLL